MTQECANKLEAHDAERGWLAGINIRMSIERIFHSICCTSTTFLNTWPQHGQCWLLTYLTDLCLLKPCLIICLCLGAAFLWYFVHRSCRKTAQRTVFLRTSDGSSSVKSGIISKHQNVSWAPPPPLSFSPSLSHSHYSQPIVIYHYLLLLYFLCLFAEYALLIIIILIIMLLLPLCVDVSLKSCHGNGCLKLFSDESFSSKHEKGLCT